MTPPPYNLTSFAASSLALHPEHVGAKGVLGARQRRLQLNEHFRTAPASQPLKGKTMSRNRSNATKTTPSKSEARADKKAPAWYERKQKATLKEIGGGDDNYWNSRIGQRLFAALPGITPENAPDASRATMSGLLDIKSADPIEGMLASQIIAAHETSMHLRQLAWLTGQHFVVQEKYLELAEKAARTMGMLTERLDQHRGRGQQQITVKHVTVNADQAMVADIITTGKASQKGSALPPVKRLMTGERVPMDILATESHISEVAGMKNMSNEPMQSAHAAPRCGAKSKRTGKPCRAPAVRGYRVCRMHAAGGGGPTGRANGNDRRGGGLRRSRTLSATLPS